eukprot:m.182858 g.182858  ORF g.182858 m.182858 type:complete len:548 (+) comp32136_c2_seq1:159-1802(+)
MGVVNESEWATNFTAFGYTFDTSTVSLEEWGSLLASYGLIAIIAIRIGHLLSQHLTYFIAVLTAWLLWLGSALFYTGSISWDDMTERGFAVQAASQAFVLSLKDFLVAWVQLLIPFWSDLSIWVKRLWDSLDTTSKLVALGVGLFTWGIFQVYLKAKKHANTLKDVGFQASFALVAPVVWYGSDLVFTALPVGALPFTVRAMLSAVPAVQSIFAFRLLKSSKAAEKAKGTKRANLWLSYWACWPTVNFVGGLILAYTTEVFRMQRVLLVLLIWLQFWQGSKHVPDLVMRFATHVGFPVWSVLTASLPSWIQNPTMFLYRHMSSVSAAVSYIRTNKMMSLIFGIAFLLVLSTIITTISGVLTTIIWWGASLKTTEVVVKEKRDDYAGQISFWVLALLSEALVTIPVVGMFVAMWQPLFLSIALTMGETIFGLLVTVLFSFVSTHTKKESLPKKRDSNEPMVAASGNVNVTQRSTGPQIETVPFVDEVNDNNHDTDNTNNHDDNADGYDDDDSSDDTNVPTSELSDTARSPPKPYKRRETAPSSSSPSS